MDGENNEREDAEEGSRRRGLDSETLLEVIPDLVFRIDRGGKFLDFRANDDDELYVAREAIVGRTLRDAMPPEVADEALRCIARALETGEAQACEYRLPMPRGTLDYEGRMVASGADEVLCLVRDVTERKLAEEALKESEKLFRQLFEQSSDALLVHDGAGMMVDCNAEACRSLGYSREELLSLSVEDFGLKLVSDEEGLDRGGMLWQRVMAAEPGTVAGVVLGMHRRKDGTTFPVEVRLSGVDYGGRRLILASCRDLTERRALEGRLAHQAFHDYLTGLPNRALFAERLSRALGRADRDGEPACLLFLDLDGFKEVNDRHGHEAGDALLAAAAGRIRRCLRPSDTAARMGGDEFAVLLEGLGPERAREVAARIGEALGAPFAVGGEEARVGASVGMACAVPGQKDAAGLLGEADREMYRAKKRGRGRGGARRRED